MDSARQLAEWVRDARQRTFDLVEDLSDAQLLGPRLAIVNPLLWEIGHVAWFQEKWVVRYACGLPPVRTDADAPEGDRPARPVVIRKVMIVAKEVE